jgi:benzodiazapine receptor
MIGGWTELLLRKRLLGTGTTAASAMTVGTAALVATAWKVARPAAASVIPLAGWL